MDKGLNRLSFLRVALSAIVLFVALLGLAVKAVAEERIALVIGNGGYQSVSPLDNPVRDARDLARTLEATGFAVTLLIDADQSALNSGIAQFGRALRTADKDATGLFYYAGHGVQSFGTNYLVPVDATLKNAADLDLVAVTAESVLRQMQSARNKTNIVILDACRDNPFEAVADIDDNGLAEMKAPTGTFLAYSTAPGAVALDGVDGNSPFTKALLSSIPEKGVPIEQLFKKVRVEVLEQTGGLQVPWDASSLTGNFIFVPEPEVAAADAGLEAVWSAVNASRDPLQVLLFLRAHSDSSFAEPARALLNELMVAELSPPAPSDKAAAAPPQPIQKSAEAKPATEPAPQLAVPADQDAERALLETARQSGAAEDYQAYLDRFPDGIFAELAQFELALLAEKDAPAVVAALPNGDRALQIAPKEPEAGVPAPTGTVTFSDPLETGGPGVAGVSLEELIQGKPLFPPIEGLPDSVWKDHSCSNCHQWTREALCTQAKTYLTNAAPGALAKSHPLGGGFKSNLRYWAQDGCQ